MFLLVMWLTVVPGLPWAPGPAVWVTGVSGFMELVADGSTDLFKSGIPFESLVAIVGLLDTFSSLSGAVTVFFWIGANVVDTELLDPGNGPLLTVADATFSPVIARTVFCIVLAVVVSPSPPGNSALGCLEVGGGAVMVVPVYKDNTEARQGISWKCFHISPALP